MSHSDVTDLTKAAIIRDAEALKPFPKVVQKVLPLLRDLAPINKLEEVIQYDPVICARVIRMAQSAYYSRGKRVKTLGDAIAWLGQRHLCETIVLSCTAGYINGNLEAYGCDDVNRMWKHFVAVATVSQLITTRLELGSSLAIYMTGLLHDIGKLVLDKYLRQRQNEFDSALSEGLSTPQAEEKVLGLDHCTVGDIIGKSWKFPPLVREGIKYHHAPEKASPKFQRNIAAVYCANLIADKAGFGLTEEYLTSGDGIERWRFDPVELPPPVIKSLVKEAKTAIKDATNLLTI